ncbi:hypothetical protein GLAREA_05171 [Glarea lozoyensis ATCC 20868]|uniref:Uncharacterized protein n=1 Tax=Glarea lozoyensis (strain ATCC 20868 / MF5171) TaxID=1116229 RepID=S3EC15_GLAL2|nr:uncharacterized protein GLAREA_05171 [Glarea lozoyensis ATCC 20868]EPE35833.1 hypothetical protein GLAREA_05171 [Glarea lozoyensis ATCC 20868]
MATVDYNLPPPSWSYFDDPPERETPPPAQAQPSLEINTNIDSDIFVHGRLIPLTARHLQIKPQLLKLKYYSRLNETTIIRLAAHGNRHVELLLRLHGIASVHFYSSETGESLSWDAGDYRIQQYRMNAIRAYEEEWKISTIFRTKWDLPPRGLNYGL